MTTTSDPLERRAYDAAKLMAEHPPIWNHPNKLVVFGIACPPGAVSKGELRYSRWSQMTAPEVTDPGRAVQLVESRPGYFDYAPETRPGGAVEWHVNFADPRLFVAYGSSLFAQDEMQVAEHPILGSLREALDADDRAALTVDGTGATPILVMGAERRCSIATDSSTLDGRPHGLYGNAFARASADAIARATTRLEPPSTTNLIAMAAPPGGRGTYRADVIASILGTAYTGFRAAALESAATRPDLARVVVHTGFWGCGAFGGNRVLMSILQALAADLAGIDRLVFHTGPVGGEAPLGEALAILAAEPQPAGIDDEIARLESESFEWGVSDGN